MKNSNSNFVLKVCVLCFVVEREIIPMVNVCASLVGKEKSAISDMKNVRCLIAVDMVTVRMESVTA